MDVKKIGKFIAENRKKKNLTQEQLAERLGVTSKTISRWENGNYMPDISLLKPLSEELEITLNDLISGEKVDEEHYQEKLEKSLVNTIDYSKKQIEKTKLQESYIIMIIGILIAFCAILIFNPESSWGSVYSIIGIIVFVVGLFKTLKFKNFYKKLGISILTFAAIFSLFYFVDMLSVCEFKRPPMYRYKTTTDFTSSKVITYNSALYNVYRINADTKNEYYIIDIGKKQTKNSIPITPFNRDKSGIDNIIKYKNKYIGNNSNIGNLVYNLPLSEFGYVFEIDSKNYSLTIDYSTTDWYNNENHYIKKSLLYNSVSIFALIDNVQEINYNFSGNSYKANRQQIETSYPNYNEIVSKNEIDKENFYKYLENKLTDDEFVSNTFNKIFDSNSLK